jgi:hypothetical protein
MKVLLRQLGLLSLLASTGLAFDYAIDEEAENPRYLELIDNATSIRPIVTIFKGQQFNVTVTDVSWTPSDNSTDSDTLIWTTTINGALVGEGTYSLADFGRQLPNTFFVGSYVIDNQETATIVVNLILDDVNSETSDNYQVYAAGLSIVPLIVVLVLAMTTRMVRTPSLCLSLLFVDWHRSALTHCLTIQLYVKVEFSLFTGVFVGACIVAGNINEGFKRTLDTYVLEAMANKDHVQVVLFTLFISGLVGTMVSAFVTRESWFSLRESLLTHGSHINCK